LIKSRTPKNYQAIARQATPNIKRIIVTEQINHRRARFQIINQPEEYLSQHTTEYHINHLMEHSPHFWFVDYIYNLIVKTPDKFNMNNPTQKEIVRTIIISTVFKTAHHI
jgi:hypothetical protein